MGRDLESLFDRYRRRGDLRALTRVFDRTARDLLGLAQHLVHDPHDAEDLVQTTFVTAIDRAEGWDRERPLLPWLTGILAHQASNLVRTRRRRAAEGLGSSADGAADPASGPAGRAEAAELQGELTRALDRVGARYREVLQPYLCEGERPEAIARALGRAPGTVRTQIYRGLTRLRRLLPASVGAGLLLGTVRGLPAVRAAVLSHAAQGVAPAASVVAGASGASGASSASVTSSVASGLILGGSIVSKKVLVLGAGALAASIGLWAGASGSLSPVSPSTVAPPGPQESSATLAGVSPSALEVAGEPAAGTAADSAASPDREPVRRGRVLLRGRLIGVAPEHLEGVALAVRRLRQHWLMPTDSRALAYGQEYFSYNHRLGDLAAIETNQSMSLDLASGTLLQGFNLQGNRWGAVNSVVPAQDILELEGARILADGRYEIDLTSAFEQGEEAAEQTPTGTTISVTAGHEVYFEGSAQQAFDAGTANRIEAGEEIVVDLDLVLRPAAVLRGRVRRVDEQEQPIDQTLFWGLQDSRQHALELAIAETYRVHLWAAVETTVEASGGHFSITLVPSSGMELALLRAGDEVPFTTTRAELDGSFEFRVEEDGPFVLVAVEGERPPVSRPVHLEMRRVVELEEDVPLDVGPILSGLVEDFGAFPGGGIALEAERLDLPGDVPIDWSNHGLAWSHGDVLRLRAGGRTEAGGLFTLRGLSPGTHRLRLAATGTATLFSPEQRDAAAVEVAVPANDVQLVLPLAVLEVRAELPAFHEAEEPLRLLVEDPESDATLAEARLDDEGGGEVVARPGQRLRLRVEGAGLVFPAWEGVAPAAGERLAVPLRGESAPEDD